MLGSFWSSVTVGIAVLVGIAGLSYELAGRPQPPERHDGGGRVHRRRQAQAARRLPQLGVRRRGGYPQRPQRRRGRVPRVPLRLHGPGELRPLREDRRVPRRHRADQGTHRRRRQGGGQRQWLLPWATSRGLEASIKDSKRFKDEPGNWAYFSFGHKYPLKAEAAKNAASACNQCHQDNAKKDWVFSQYYPVLRAAAHHSK